MHIVFVSGVFGEAVGMLMLAAKDWGGGITYKTLYAAADGFRYPRLLGSGVRDLFSKKRASTHMESQCFKSTASEGLNAMVFLEYFFAQVAEQFNDPEVTHHVCCFLMLCNIVRAIQRRARGPLDIHHLQYCIDSYLGAFSALYGSERMKPKHHYIVRFSAMPPAPAASRPNMQMRHPTPAWALACKVCNAHAAAQRISIRLQPEKQREQIQKNTHKC